MTNQETSNSVGMPVSQQNRITLLDSLRGVAILGILLMNIPIFAWDVMSWDPSIKNEFGTINYYLWYFVSWVPEGTQRALFSMLFGAGIILFVNGKEKQNSTVSATDYFFRRQLWLLVFGLINIYVLLWRGDILFDYGCYGMLMFVFRLWEPQKLLIAAGVCFLLMFARENRDLYLDKAIIAKGEIIEKIDAKTTKLTEQQQDDLAAFKEIKEHSTLENKIKRMEKANRLMTGSYEEVYTAVTDKYLHYFMPYLYFSIWDVIAFMLLGMAFFKMGVLSGTAPTPWYAVMSVVGLGLGLWLTNVLLHYRIDSGFNRYIILKNMTVSFADVGRLLRTLGIFGTLMLMYKSGAFGWFFRLFQPVGQMAFTNYLTQSLICMLIFTGIGLGYFGKLERYEGYIIVGCIWGVQIIWSHIWLRYFRFGPLEWLWRSLTYWKRQPMKR
ncbi:MAG: DUF418 domain-containing protein [Spirosomataceae bacterium]